LNFTSSSIPYRYGIISTVAFTRIHNRRVAYEVGPAGDGWPLILTGLRSATFILPSCSLGCFGAFAGALRT
jgi:hypothetical protein